MKQLVIIMLLISLSLGAKDIKTTGKDKKKDTHVTQKKQFVNFINDDGEYARNFVDLTTNEADGFDDLFRGRGAGGGVMGGSMQLTENSLGGLALDGDSMEPAYNQLAGNGFSSLDKFEDGDTRSPAVVHVYPALRPALHRRHHGHPLRRYFICRANQESPWLKLKCASSNLNSDLYSGGVGTGDNYGNNYNNPAFFGSFDVNQPNQDIMSPFYNSESKLEDNINLSDTINGNNQIDLSSFNEALQGLNHQDGLAKYPHLHMDPSAKNKNVGADPFGSEFGDLDSSDDKLQKLLESSIGNNEDSGAGAATIGSFLSALLSQQGNGNNFHPQHLGQATPSDETATSNNNYDTQNQMQQSALNQLSGTLSQNGMPVQAPVTVHVHASDKPGAHGNTPPPPDESRAIAQQAQDVAMKAHKEKLARLKKRLALLRQKLSELEDEQSKKSSKTNDPRERRRNAIKKILIKNLKVAAMITSRQVQIEESKGRQIESMSRKKNDNELSDDNARTKFASKMLFSKPVTELSRKAEDEVNHLTSLEKTKHLQNGTSSRKTHINATITDAEIGILRKPPSNLTFEMESMGNSTLLRKDVTNSPTTTDGDTSVSKTNTVSKKDQDARIFLKKLRDQISSMSDQISKGRRRRSLKGKRKLRKYKEKRIRIMIRRNHQAHVMRFQSGST